MSISLETPLIEPEIDPSLPGGGEVLDTVVLLAIAAGLAEVSTPWDLRPGDSPDERHYERLLVTPTYEAWLIFWPAGTRLDLHDHGGSAGAFSVVDGSLDETTFEHGRPNERRINPGGVSTFAPAQVHGVANNGGLPATSVHVYSPPLESMRYYARAADGSLSEVRLDARGWEGER